VASVLQSARQRRIIVAYAVNRLGTWFGMIALMVAVFDRTHSALAVAGLLLAWQALPAFVVPGLVAKVEASARRSELSGLYFFEAAATSTLAILLWNFWLPAVLLVAALDGTASLAASALLRAALARAAREEEAISTGSEQGPAASREDAAQAREQRANAALNVAFSATFVLGPAIGGAVVSGAGAPAALFIDVGSFAVCGAMLLDLHPHVEQASEGSVRTRLREAWRHINEAPSLRWLLLMDAIAIMFYESAGPIEVAYAKATLRAGDRGFGLLLTTWGAGAVLGSLIFARSPKRSLGAMLSAGALAIGLAYIGFAAAPSLLIACIAAFIGGVGNGVELPSLISIVQRLTPQHLHGRLMGAVESLTAMSLAIGLPMGGALVALGSPRAAFLAIGAGAAATSIALLRLSRGSATGPGAPGASHEEPTPMPDTSDEGLVAEPGRLARGQPRADGTPITVVSAEM
jgi:predicted MFS family arabinose efflux permease